MQELSYEAQQTLSLILLSEATVANKPSIQKAKSASQSIKKIERRILHR